jgi:hypothetical protein
MYQERRERNWRDGARYERGGDAWRITGGDNGAGSDKTGGTKGGDNTHGLQERGEEDTGISGEWTDG